MEQKAPQNESDKGTEDLDPHILRKYDIASVVGRGSFGIVFRAVDRKTGEMVALKKCFGAFRNSSDAQRTFREIMYLQELNGHENIISLLGVLRADNDNDIYLVFERMESDLHALIRGGALLDVHKQYVVYQIFKALTYMHSGQVMHRDLKPANILVNADCLVKVCDFGLARCSLSQIGLGQISGLTEYVATRWYRAPEIMLGSNAYDQGVDIWSMGCIIAELYSGKPMFPGTSTMNQLELIIRAIGFPTPVEIEGMRSPFAVTLLESFSNTGCQPLSSLVPTAPEEALDLLRLCIPFNISKRVSARDSLRHPFLLSFFEPNTKYTCDRIIQIQILDRARFRAEEFREVIYHEVSKKTKDKGRAQKHCGVSAGQSVKQGQALQVHQAQARPQSQPQPPSGAPPPPSLPQQQVVHQPQQQHQQRLPQVMQQPLPATMGQQNPNLSGDTGNLAHLSRSKSVAAMPGATLFSGPQRPSTTTASKSTASLFHRTERPSSSVGASTRDSKASSSSGNNFLRMPSLAGKSRSNMASMGVPGADANRDAKNDEALKPGLAVHVHGLIAAPQLNGQCGTLEKWDGSIGRWNVRLDSSEVKAFKPENIFAAGVTVQIHDLKGAPELNGKDAICEEFDSAKGRWRVCLRSGEVKLIRPENLQRPERPCLVIS